MRFPNFVIHRLFLFLLILSIAGPGPRSSGVAAAAREGLREETASATVFASNADRGMPATLSLPWKFPHDILGIDGPGAIDMASMDVDNNAATDMAHDATRLC